MSFIKPGLKSCYYETFRLEGTKQFHFKLRLSSFCKCVSVIRLHENGLAVSIKTALRRGGIRLRVSVALESTLTQ